MDSVIQRITNLSRSRFRIPILLALIGVCLYFPFRSSSLDDFDAYSFALALDNFNLNLQQPHPPGFPIYIALGRMLQPLTRSPTAALTLLSAICGIAVLLLIYALGCVLNPEHPFTGVGAALTMAFIPMTWLTAEKALSDMPGLAFTLAALWLLLRDSKSIGEQFAGGLMAGLSLGVRPHNAAPIIILFLVLTLQNLRNHNLRSLILKAAGLMLGTLLWALPLLITAGGIRPYLSHVIEHAAHVGSSDSLWKATDAPLGTLLRGRLFSFGDTFLSYLVGVEIFSPLSFTDVIRLVFIALVSLIGLARSNWHNSLTHLLALWAGITFAQIFLFQTLDRPRLMLPLLPPLLLLIAQGWSQTQRQLGTSILIIVTFALALHTIPLASIISTTPSPPQQATKFIQANYAAEETLIAAAGSFRAVQYHLPQYHTLYAYTFDPAAARSLLSEQPKYVVVFDRDQFPSTFFDILSAEGRYVPLEDRTFTRTRFVHTQHDQVRVQILTPGNLLPASALALPEDDCINIGSQTDGRYLTQGWFRPENIGGVEGRWAGGLLTSTLRVNLDTTRSYTLTLRTLAYPAEQSVTILVNDRPLQSLNIPQGWLEHNILLPATVLPTSEGEIVTLSLIHKIALSPFEFTNGASSNTRKLTVAYDWICFSQNSKKISTP
jgi:hypothetical protein